MGRFAVYPFFYTFNKINFMKWLKNLFNKKKKETKYSNTTPIYHGSVDPAFGNDPTVGNNIFISLHDEMSRHYTDDAPSTFSSPSETSSNHWSSDSSSYDSSSYDSSDCGSDSSSSD